MVASGIIAHFLAALLLIVRRPGRIFLEGVLCLSIGVFALLALAFAMLLARACACALALGPHFFFSR